jgi:general secretion pathway protein K
MLVVTIATVLAVELIWDLNLDLRRTETILAREQGLQVAYGLELLAAQLLEADYEDDPQAPDTLLERWAQQYNFPFEGGQVIGKLDDMQGRFNLNNLINANGQKDEIAKEQLRRLVRVATTGLDREQQVNPDTIVDSIVDWLDADQLAELGGAEDGFYTTLEPPYRAGNFWFTSISELQAVNGMTPPAFRALQGLVSALPPAPTGRRSVNVNTAPEPVLRSLCEEFTEVQTAALVEQQQSSPFESTEEFRQAVAIDDPNQPPSDCLTDNVIGITSNFFRLTVIVSIGTTRLAMYSLLERNQQGTVATRYRSFDTE